MKTREVRSGRGDFAWGSWRYWVRCIVRSGKGGWNVAFQLSVELY